MSRSRAGEIALAIVVSTCAASGWARAESREQPVEIELRPAASSILVSGGLVIKGIVDVGDDIPDGTEVNYTATADVIDASFDNHRYITGRTKVVARKIRVTVSLPYVWRLSAAGASMVVSMALSGSNSQATLSTSIVTPANGVVTPITLVGSL